MNHRIIIAGGRDFTDKKFMYTALDRLFRDFDDEMHMPIMPLEIVSGTARGADALGADWATANWVRLKEFPADWDKYGKGAGYVRNEEMAIYANVLVAFWDGKSRGTKHMIDLAHKHGLEVHVYRY